MDSSFKFKRFSVHNSASALKVGTDAVVLGATMTLLTGDRRLLDAGTGTGVIALMAAQRLSDLAAAPFHIDAVEIDPASASEAAVNFAESPWADSMGVTTADIRTFKPGGGTQDSRYDVIFSNPPFYDRSLVNPDEREKVARHTESLSYRELCAFAAENLVPGGRLSLILPAEEEKALVRTAASFGLKPFRMVRIRTTERKPFRRLVAEFRLDVFSPAPVEEELVLQNGTQRTERYAALTKDFYL